MKKKPILLLFAFSFLFNLSHGYSQLDCSTPHNIVINCTAGLLPYQLCGTTIGAPSNVNQYCGTGYDYSGGEQVIILNLKDGTPFFSEDITIDLVLTNSSSVDFDIYLFSSCNLNNCLASATSGSFDTETLTYTGSSIWDIEDAFIVIDGYNGSEADYELVIEVEYDNSTSEPVNSISTKLHQLSNEPTLCMDDFPTTGSVLPLVGVTQQDITVYDCGNEGIFTGFAGSERFHKIATSAVADLTVNLSQTSGDVHAFIFRQNIYTANCSPANVTNCYQCLGYATENAPYTLQNAAVDEYFIVVDAPLSGGYTIDVDFDDACNNPPTGCNVWDQVGSDIDGEAANDRSGQSVSLSADGTRVAIGADFNDGNGDRSGHVRVYEESGGTWTQVGGDIDGEAAFDRSGQSVSLSADGARVAIGAQDNEGNGDDAGHVRIYEENGGTWTQVGSDIDGEAGNSAGKVSLSADGTRVAIGAPTSNGITGLVRIYQENGGQWTQVGSNIDGEAGNNEFGFAVSLSSSGDRVAIGGIKNDGNGDNAGHARIYQENGGSWTQVGSDIDGEAANDFSGYSVSLSSDGNRVAIGAILNDGNGENAGHVRVYEESGGVWIQVGSDIDGEAAGDFSGYPVSLSSDGKIVAIGAILNDGNGDDAGHVRIYEESGGVWTQIVCDIDGEAADDESGSYISLSANGNRIAIGARQNDGNGDDAGHVRIYASNEVIANDEVTFEIAENICGNPGNVVTVPVAVQHFESIGGFQMSIHVADPDVATFVGASDFNLPNMNNNAFQVTNNGEVMLVTWFNSSGITLDDDTPIFSIDISLTGMAGESSNIFMDGDPSPFLVFDDNVNEVPATSTTGSVCIDATAEIFGKIYRENLDEVSQVTIGLDGVQMLSYETTTDGLYEFTSVPSNENYTITPSKEINPVNGVNVGDILKIQKFINQVPGFLNSPYHRIAADVSNDGLILVNDILFIQKLINNNISTFPNGTPSWKFISSDYAFTTSAPEGENFVQTRVYNQISGTLTGQDFIGIKMGDVDDSGNPVNLDNESNKVHLGTSGEAVEIFMDAGKAISGDVISVPIKANNFTDLGGMQFSVVWDHSILSFAGVDNFSLDNLNEPAFSFKENHEGILTVAWFTSSCEKVPDNSTLFEIKFEVTGQEGAWSEISFSDSPTAISFFDCEANTLQHSTTNGKISVSNIATQVNDIAQKEKVIVYPNPAQHQLLNIQFIGLENIDEWDLKLTNVQGQDVKSFRLKANSTQIGLPLNNIIPGIYFLEIISNKFKFIEKVMIE